MKRALQCTFTAVASAIVAIAAADVSATTAIGPYYATPSWDQKLACTAASNCPRFVVLSNWIDSDFPSGGAAILDRETGLVWQRSPGTSQTEQSNAQVNCANEGTGGRGSWRVPSYQELASLFEYTGQFGNLPTGHPFQNLQAGNYWSYNQYQNATSGWMISFANGANQRAPVATLGYVLCVRSGIPGATIQ